ncbi:MAG: arylsulfatase [Parahaliea sp.]
MRTHISTALRLIVLLLISPVVSFQAMAAENSTNILVIFGDDIGYWNLSVNNAGMMGYSTPNIDSIARDGIRFTDYYGEQSCTAGRSAFITGQSPLRTGLTKVGMPGAEIGLQKEDITLAALLKERGYKTGQFGKNHLGDRDEFLPTAHGFDEFFGNLYHLNAEEEPENPDFPTNTEFRRQYTPRGVIRSYADGVTEDSGPLSRQRMETVDQEFAVAAKQFMEKSVAQNKPFFLWFNATRMHFYTHVAENEAGLSGQGFYNDAMVGHDRLVGTLLDKLDELAVADNTIVLYTTDNGPHYNTWPDAGITPFRGKKNTNWEGGYRVPAMVKWPGHIPAGVVSNDIMSHMDWLPTLVAVAGGGDVVERLKAGARVDGKPFKNHLDGYNFLPYLTGKSTQSPRDSFIYWSDDGLLTAIRIGDWKLVFNEQRATRFDVWRDPFVTQRIPKLFNLRRDPFERGDTDSNAYNEWWGRRIGPYIGLAKMELGEFLQTLEAFPPRQRSASFTVDQMLEKYLP